jgi:endonuclease/exonuclease/phosphatase family metal-dependent hydrolase
MPAVPYAIDRVVADLPVPEEAVLAAARAAPKDAATHASFASRIPALHALEAQPPATHHPAGDRLTIAAFNVERLKSGRAVRALLDGAGPDAALLCEVDCGMARSGNRHSLRDLAQAGGEGYLYGVEYVELDLGDRKEMREHDGKRNAASLHGNGVLSRLRLVEARMVRLEEGGSWFAGREGAQRRIGGRMALVARVAEARRPVWLVCVHLESKSDPKDRAAQVDALLQALDSVTGDAGAAVVIGGDFNTKALPRALASQHGGKPALPREVLAEPERWEPLFARLRASGYSWESANLPLPTQRTGPAGDPEPPFGKLDWLFVRGLRADNPRLVPALDPDGRPVSDHEMLTVDVTL